MTDKQFNDAFTTAGGWFILTQYETIASWSDNRTDLISHIFSLGYDSSVSGSQSRVSAVLRLIREDRIKEAILKASNSERINIANPKAYKIGETLLIKHFGD